MPKNSEEWVHVAIFIAWVAHTDLLTHCDLVTPYGDIYFIWVNIGSGNALLPYSTKPLSKPMLTFHWCGPVIIHLRANSQEISQPSITRISLKISYLKFHSYLPGVNETHWGRDKMDAISQTTFSNAISWMKMFEFRLKFHWSLFLRFQLTIYQHWFRYWLGAVQATSHYLNQWWLIYWCIYASLGLNELTNGACCLAAITILVPYHIVNTLKPRQNDCHFSDDIF